MAKTALLEKLMEITGASGNEQKIRAFIMKEIKKHVDDVKVDKFGNLIAHKKGKGPKVMVAAHMDEIGLIIKGIDSEGKIFVSEIGGVEAVGLIGQRVKIHSDKGPVSGVITTPEVSDTEDIEDVPAISDLVIDVGLNKKQLKLLGIGVGSFVELVQETTFLGKGDKILGKALDDRSGCYILLEVAKRLKKSELDIYFVFTVQEEVGLYGAKTSAWKVEPDWAIVVDVTNADDFMARDYDATKVLGNGPCVNVKDADTISNICVDEWLKATAKKLSMNLQMEVTDLGSTDALSISVSKGGIPTSTVGVAIRNLHTTASVASLQDIEDTIQLLTELLKKHPKKCIV